MSHTITLTPSQISFSTEVDETILDAAKRHNLNLPHSCQNGICGACKARIVSGSLIQGEHSDKALTPAEAEAGMALLCGARAQSDVVIDLPHFSGTDSPPIKTLPSRIQQIERFGSVAVLTLALPKNQALSFWPGQYLDVLLKDGHSRSYSLANAPHQNETIELHIKHHPGGLFSETLFSGSLKEKDILRLKAPLGSFTLNDSDKPIILLATGTGYAPMQSLLQHLLHTSPNRAVHLYWGVRHHADFYHLQQAQQLIAALPAARFTPVLSQPLLEDAWSGAVGYVQHIALSDYPDLRAHEVYACGSSEMVMAAQTTCIQAGLPPQAFYADAFTPATT